MSLALRPYQHDLVDRARALIRAGQKRILIQSPTGSGKTVLVAHMLKTASGRGHSAWFNVHRRELVKQSVLTLTESAGIKVGIVAAGFPSDRRQRVQVNSIATLRQRRHLLAPPGLIVWDEAHHVAAASWAAIFDAHKDAVHIGLTATPERLDGTGLVKWFDHLITGPTVADLIQQEYLCDYKLYAPKPPDLEGVHTVAGDFNKKELAAAMKRSSVTGDVISHYRKLCMGARMVLFAWSVESSKLLADAFRRAGVAAEHVDGDTDPGFRDLCMERFRAGEVRVLCNVDLFGEGVDVPAIEAVALLRPTQSLALYLQQVGRALRPSPGKRHAVILDHAGNCRRFGLPDDDRDWTLEGRRRVKRADDAMPIRQCPLCYAVVRASADRCKHCGHVFIATPREIERVDGELEEVDPARIREQRLREQTAARTVEELTVIAQRRGYKNPEKWARMIDAHRKAKQAAREAGEWLQRG